MAHALTYIPLLLALLNQAETLPSGPMPDSLSPAQQSKLEAAQKIDRRIKIYDEASDQRRHAAEKAAGQKNSDAVTSALRSWTELLDYALTDIRANAKQSSRSKALKNFEIHLRKAIGEMGDLETKVSYEQYEEFKSWMKHAGEVRQKLVLILFPGSSARQ
jgi:hypothetical protein